MSTKPEWIKIRIQTHPSFSDTLGIVRKNVVRTVCEDAGCPNINECWRNKTATFLIMGEYCTRNCGFCDIKPGRPFPIDEDEPERVALSTRDLGLEYVVVTSVTRDDLPDGGASHFSNVINRLREINPCIEVEILTPDFLGCTKEAIEIIIGAGPNVFGHNLEIVKEHHSIVKRPPSNYDVSMHFLRTVKESDEKILTKTGIMVGVGESTQNVMDCINEVKDAGVDIMTIGQYLPPSQQHHTLHRYVDPNEFEEYERYGNGMGIKMICGPLVRSSYRAKEVYSELSSSNSINT
ncbi:MAG: lipoyl synthase [Holosporales bacterium]|jgi:lipoic acid synthetase|nr:lipoyl synthase [Holosporales bacterium]